MAQILDIYKIYRTQDDEEAFWRFEYRTVGEVTGWWAFRKRPEDKTFLCIGTKTTKEIKDFLKKHDHPLVDDDLIDIELIIQNWIERED